MLSFEEANEINLKVAELTSRTVIALRAEQDRVGIQSRSGNLKKINVRFTKKENMINRISFKFKRYGVFVEKGARRGHGGRVGSKWKDKNGQEVRTNPASLNKMDSGNSPAKEWFNPVIENFTQRLTEEVALEFVNLSFRNLRIR